MRRGREDSARPGRTGRHRLDMVSLVEGLLLAMLSGLLLAADAGVDAVPLAAAAVVGVGVLMLLVVLRPRPGRRAPAGPATVADEPQPAVETDELADGTSPAEPHSPA